MSNYSIRTADFKMSLYKQFSETAEGRTGQLKTRLTSRRQLRSSFHPGREQNHPAQALEDKQPPSLKDKIHEYS